MPNKTQYNPKEQNKEKKAKISPLGGFKAWLIWSVATLFLVFVSNLQSGYGLINEMMGADLEISLSRIGFIATLYTTVFAVTQLLSGSLLDRLGIRKTLPVAMFLAAGGALILGLAQNYAMILLSQVVLALGASFAFVGAGFAGGKWFGASRYGFMFGLVQTVSCAGTLLGGFLLSRWLKTTHWNDMIRYLAFFGMGLAFLSLFIIRDRDVESVGEVESLEPIEFVKKREKTSFSKSIASFFKSIGEKLFFIIRHPQIWLISSVCSVLFGTLLSLVMVWGGRILQSHGIETVLAHRLILLLWAGVALGAPLADKFSFLLKSRKRALLIDATLFFILLLVFLFIPLSPILTGIVIVLMGFFNGGHMLSFTLATEHVPELYGGTAASVVNGLVFLTGGVFLSLPGLMRSPSFFGPDLSLPASYLPAVILIGLVLLVNMLFLKDTFGLITKKD